MPNWVMNRVTILGPTDVVDELLEAIRNDEAHTDIDFDRIAPMPEVFKERPYVIGGEDEALQCYRQFLKQSGEDVVADKSDRLPAVTEEQKETYRIQNGIDTYTWGLGQWLYENLRLYGVKDVIGWCIENWGTKWIAEETERECNTLRFLTANSAPEKVLDKLSRTYPAVTIEHEWASEYIGQSCGKTTYQNGRTQPWDTTSYYHGRSAYEAYADIWGVHLRNDKGYVLCSRNRSYCDRSELKHLHLSGRARNELIKSGRITTMDLQPMTRADLLAIKGIGPNLADEILRKLADFNTLDDLLHVMDDDLSELDDNEIAYAMSHVREEIEDVFLYTDVEAAGADDAENDLRKDEDDEEWGEFLCSVPGGNYLKLPTGRVLWFSVKHR